MINQRRKTPLNTRDPRVQKLSEFLETRAALTVHSNEQLNLLVIQLHCMKAYQSVLERRIQILKEDKQ